MLQAMGNPCKEIPAVQVVGTNGKGSIASFLKSCFKVAGIRAGVTTSPHLVSWKERICIDGKMISIEELRTRLISKQALFETYKLTPFEMLMSVAFDYFADKQVEVLVLEAGLGGRLDATTAHPYRPIIAMASIGFDHCEYLGKSLRDIAIEKVDVLHSGGTLISAYQQPEVVELLEDIAKERMARINWVDPIPRDWKLGLDGEFQRQNAAVAKGVLEALSGLGWSVNELKIREGFASAKWTARLQSLKWRNLPLLVDGAHNPSAAEQLAKERENWAGQESGVIWILGIQAHKEGPQIVDNLIKSNDMVWIVPVPGHLSWTKTQLSDACPEFSGQIFQAEGVEQVLLDLRMLNRWPSPAPVVTGSLYLLGDLFENQIITED